MTKMRQVPQKGFDAKKKGSVPDLCKGRHKIPISSRNQEKEKPPSR